jgi:plastocyanin
MSNDTTSSDGAERTQVWLTTTRLGAVVLVVWSAVLQVTVGMVIPPVLAVGVVFAGLILLLGIRRRWVGLVATLLGLAAVGGNVPSMVEELSHPSSALAFILTLIATTAGVVLMVAGLGGFFRWPARPGVLIWSGVAVVLVGSALALVAASRVEALPMIDGDIVVVTKANEFSPDRMTAPPGRVAVWIDNRDGARHTFSSPALGVDVDVVGLKSQRVEFEVTAGEYVIFCAVVGHEQMTTTLVVAG